MNKKLSLFFCLSFILIFVSCNNIFLNGETKDISFCIDDEIVNKIAHYGGSGTDYTVVFYFDGLDREPFTVNVSKEKIRTTKFNIKKIPLNITFKILMKIFDGAGEIYWGLSNNLNFDLSNRDKEINICLYRSYNFTNVPKKIKDIEITIEPNSPVRYDIVEFGDWPQSKYTGDVSKLEPCKMGVNAWDKSVCFTDGEGGYYIKVNANPKQPDYKFNDGTQIIQDAPYYFKLEPIQWRILSKNYNNKQLLLAENALDVHIYDDTSTNYKDSDIRAYLNGAGNYSNIGFLQKAFSRAALSNISLTNVDNGNDSTQITGELVEINTNICPNTEDKIFLLSLQEITRNEYGFNKTKNKWDSNIIDPNRYRKATDYSKALGSFVKTQDTDVNKNGNSWWWLRSPLNGNSQHVRDVSYHGRVGNYPIYDKNINHSDVCIVPALCIPNPEP